MKRKFAIVPTREEDYSEWYQQVLKAADLAENAPVRGCMIMKPWGYGLWEQVQAQLDKKIKESGHENVYFPLFIPLSFLEKEAAHIEGFAKECAVVTHHRLEAKDGKLIPTGELEEPLVVRPTSETIIGFSFSKWVQSHRDLPLLLNQWCNVVRWEMRPRLFLRTVEFLWQEGHTAHATAKEAQEETLRMLEIYRTFIEESLAIPVIAGTKTPGEKFPGAENTYTLEGMMQDRKALQMATSHALGQNFSKGFNIRFTNQDGALEYAYTTSWGVTTRLLGGLIMVHSDDDGLRVPPRIASKHLVIIPFVTQAETAQSVLDAAEKAAERLRQVVWNGSPLQVVVDKREIRGGEKGWQWVKRGIPLRIEIGPRDIEEGVVSLGRRDKEPKEMQKLSLEEVAAKIPEMLDAIQEGYYAAAKKQLHDHTKELHTWDEFLRYFTPKNEERPEIHGGFAKGKWCEDAACEAKIADHKVSIRCLPLKQSHSKGTCLVCSKPATLDAIYAKSY